ncbi:3-oxoacyl-[acyl-carrier-protein] synthase 3 [termite gut metagenome]|uniref:3-oxoacyl-[acyl-carrier-protein] synthase 3 n=1 Tax=termite gut metagenome TaxID=433724 RepID=A0A5J4R8X9_9ZZZZ
MPFLECKNVKISGLSSCVPKNVEYVKDYPLFSSSEIEKFTTSTGVLKRHLVSEGITSSDLCYEASESIIKELDWDKNDIDILIFVSQTRDYILPSTSCILQHRLGISTNCYTMDIPYGCSGYIYGLSTITSLMSGGYFKKELLLVGDAVHVHHNFEDKSSYPLFGDAGTATALEFSKGEDGFKFHFGTDESGYNAIIIPDGGYRNKFSTDSLIITDYANEGKRSNADCYLNGMDVFSFGISRAPESVKNLCKYFSLNLDDVDYFVMHQANRFLNEMIRKKLNISEEKIINSLKEYGNTSCASIPLSMHTQIKDILQSDREAKILNCGFGVGLSWGSVYYKTRNIVCPDIIEI